MRKIYICSLIGLFLFIGQLPAPVSHVPHGVSISKRADEATGAGMYPFSDGDLYISNRLEVDSTSYFDGLVYVGSITVRNPFTGVYFSTAIYATWAIINRMSVSTFTATWANIVNIAQSTISLQSQLYTVGVTTGTLRTDLTTESSTRLTVDNRIGVDTTTLRTDLTTEASTRLTVDNRIGIDTTTLKTDLTTETNRSTTQDNLVGVTTGQLQADLSTEVSNRQIQDNLTRVTTGQIQANVEAVAVSTGNLVLKTGGSMTGVLYNSSSFTATGDVSGLNGNFSGNMTFATATCKGIDATGYIVKASTIGEGSATQIYGGNAKVTYGIQVGTITDIDTDNTIIIGNGSSKVGINGGPSAGLEVRTDGTSVVCLRLRDTGSGGGYFSFHPRGGGGANSLYIDNNGTTRMVIDSNGRITQGTITGSSAFNVSNEMSVGATYKGTQAPTNGLIVEGGTGFGVTTAQGKQVGIGGTGLACSSYTSIVGSNEMVISTNVRVTNKLTVSTIAINNITYNFPVSQGTASTYLGNDGSGNVSWTVPPGAGDAILAGTQTFTGANTFVNPVTVLSTISATNIVTAERIRGWIVFCGTGTVAIYDSYNVTSIGDNDTGDYTITWATDFARNDYACVGMSAAACFIDTGGIGWITTSSARIRSVAHDGTNTDQVPISVIVFGDQ